MRFALAILVVQSATSSAQGCGVTMDFLTPTLAANNLGGLGPAFSEDPIIRYNGLGAVYRGDGMSSTFDMVVTNTSRYVPNNSDRNGFTFAGNFGAINLA